MAHTRETKIHSPLHIQATYGGCASERPAVRGVRSLGGRVFFLLGAFPATTTPTLSPFPSLLPERIRAHAPVATNQPIPLFHPNFHVSCQPGTRS